MRLFIQSTLGLLTLLVAVSSIAEGPVADAASADSRVARHWLPQACILSLDVERARQDGAMEAEESDEARWNRFYRLGIDAIGKQNLEQAKIDFCNALEAAGSFGPRDIRFAETLDELGLVAFMGEDYALSEAMQGAATAEMLLALGPPHKDLTEAARQSCKSSVATYMTRLGWIFERQEREQEIDPLLRQPYLILENGYVPFDKVKGRLEWLIAQYLLAEDYAAADWLASLRDGER